MIGLTVSIVLLLLLYYRIYTFVVSLRGCTRIKHMQVSKLSSGRRSTSGFQPFSLLALLVLPKF